MNYFRIGAAREAVTAGLAKDQGMWVGWWKLPLLR